ncbi:hypothetical protein [Metabacillus sp. cB07]|uniref:hypothetical protein n=1 Tax=Metabacillus sp. cB07 TaxID=2806989 RepID=UPI00193A0EE3|nr:hypothetical protein [Metabacillus sp. cB07]
MIPNAIVTKQYRFGDLTELYRSSIVTGSSELTIENDAIRFHRGAVTDKCYSYWPVYAPTGSIVEVSFEARTINLSSKGSVSFEQYSGPEVVIGQSGTPVENFEIDDIYWKPYTVTWDGSTIRPYMGIVMGMRDVVGSVYFRNIIITVYNTNNYSPEVKMCMLKYTKSSNTWIIDDAPGRFSNTGCIEVRKVGTEDALEVKFSPVESWQRPIGNAHMEYNPDTARYIAKCSSVTRNRTFINIIDMNTGQSVKLNSLPGDAYIAVNVMSQ